MGRTIRHLFAKQAFPQGASAFDSRTHRHGGRASRCRRWSRKPVNAGAPGITGLDSLALLQFCVRGWIRLWPHQSVKLDLLGDAAGSNPASRTRFVVVGCWLRGSEQVSRQSHKLESRIVTGDRNQPLTRFGDVADRICAPLSTETKRVRLPSSPPLTCSSSPVQDAAFSARKRRFKSATGHHVASSSSGRTQDFHS